LERQRALARQMAEALKPRGGGRCLEVAPLNPVVFGGYLRSLGWAYEAVDKRSIRRTYDARGFDIFIDHDLDLADLRGLATGGYEVLLLQHTLEAVADRRAAMDEIARVMEPGGRALLEIPWYPDRLRTEAKPRDQYDNRWAYGRDLVDELEGRFASVEAVQLEEGLYRGTLFVCRAA
jgi:SAM-dependent methyltransferase